MSASKPRRWLWLVFFAALVVAGGVLYRFAPGITDRVRYGGVASNCWGWLTLDGELQGEHLGGRHCHTAVQTTTTESGYAISLEYASGGMLAVYGSSLNAKDISLALVRTPEGTWYCGSRGTFVADAQHGFSGTLELTALRNAKSDDGGTLSFGGKKGQAPVASIELGGGSVTSSSCDNDARCDLTVGNETAPWHVFLRASNPVRRGVEAEADRVIILAENARAPTKVDVAEASKGKFTIDGTSGTSLSVQAPRIDSTCESGAGGDGHLTIVWR